MSFFITTSRVATTSRCLLQRQVSPLENVTSLLSSLPRTANAIPCDSRTLTKKARKPRVGYSKEQKRQMQQKKAARIEVASLRAELQRVTQPDPVLGYCPGNTREPGTNDEALWNNCELRQVILSKEEVWGLKTDHRGNLLKVDSPGAQGTKAEVADAKEFGGPTRLNYGLTREDRALLFKDLREVTVEDRIIHTTLPKGGMDQMSGMSNESAKEGSMIEEQEQTSSERLGRILDLRNASGKGIDVENKRRIIAHFGAHENDVGSVEAQVALMTYRLHLLHSHLAQPRFRKDNPTRRNMTILVHKRAKLLKYLKRTEPKRYDALLPRIGVNPRAVEGEIIVGGRPKLAVGAEATS